jgi:cation:H+ antiporter
MKKWLGIITAIVLTLPWLFLFLSHLAVPPLLQSLASGLAIVGAAFLLSWGGEAAELEIPPSLAFASVALVAVLPEYAVDIYIAAKAGRDPTYVKYAIANMTGANRLIIGVAWAMVAFLWWMRSRKRSVKIDKSHSLEFSFLFLVTLYSFWIPWQGRLSFLDGVVLIGFFVVFLWKASKESVLKSEFEEASTPIPLLPKRERRIWLIFIFVFSLFVIGTAAKPFTEGLIASGKLLHLNGFLLIQILAPLASEAPEFIVSGLLAYQGKPSLSFAALLSSKLEQWTLLVGMVPIVYWISLETGGHVGHALILDHQQIEEIFLTSAQSFFALALVADFDLSLRDASLLFILYATQYFFPSPLARRIYAITYLILGSLLYFVQKNKRVGIKKRLQSLKKENS